MNTISAISAALASAIVLTIGCASPAQSQPPPFRSLAKGAFSGITEPKKEVIKTEPEWQRFWDKHNTTAHPSEKRPLVDFKKEMVVALTLGRQRTGGYGIEVVDVQRTENRLNVSYKVTRPEPGAITIQALTAPFHFIAVPRTELKPEFTEIKS